MDHQRGRRMSTISPDEVKQLQGEFVGLDRDGDGEISISELRQLLRQMRIKLFLSETEINRAIREIDTDGDGTVDLRELNGIIQKFDRTGIIYKALSQRSQLRKDFERYDEDKSGFITKDELVEAINDRTGLKIPEKHLTRMMSECDENDDGQIDYEEFCTLMTKSFMQRKVIQTQPKRPKIK